MCLVIYTARQSVCERIVWAWSFIACPQCLYCQQHAFVSAVLLQTWIGTAICGHSTAYGLVIQGSDGSGFVPQRNSRLHRSARTKLSTLQLMCFVIWRGSPQHKQGLRSPRELPATSTCQLSISGHTISVAGLSFLAVPTLPTYDKLGSMYLSYE